MDTHQEAPVGTVKNAQVVSLGPVRVQDTRTGVVTEKKTLMFRLVGEELSPRFLPGDLFEVDSSSTPQVGKLAIFRDDSRDMLFMKRFSDHRNQGGVLFGAVVGCYGGPANM